PLPVDEVALERVLDAQGDALGLELEPAGVDSAGTVAKNLADAARKEPTEVVVAERRERADGLDPRRVQPLLGLRPDAGQPAHVEPGEKRRLLAGDDHGQAAGLARVAADL